MNKSNVMSQRVLQEEYVPGISSARGIPSAPGICTSDILDFAQDGAAPLL